MPEKEGVGDRFRKISGAQDPEAAMHLLNQVLGKEPVEDGEVIDALPIESIDLDAPKGLTTQAQADAERAQILSEEPEADRTAQEAEQSLVSKKLEGLRAKVKDMTTRKEVVPASQGDDNVEQALSTLPQHEQNDLKGIDAGLIDNLAKGPSSLVDQDVIAKLQKLPKQEQLTFLEMILSPREALTQLRAEGEERTAKATVRMEIANATRSAAELAAQDLKSKMFRAAIEQMKQTYDMDLFYQTQGIQRPPEGSLEESNYVLQNHFMWLAQRDRSQEIQKQIAFLVKRKVALQGQVAAEKMNAEMLPQLRAAKIQRDAEMSRANAENLGLVIAAREQEYPLQRQQWAQKVAHGAGLVVGTPTAVIVGGAVGALGMGYVAGKEAVNYVGQKLAESGERISQGWQNVREKIERMRQERAQGKKNRH